MSEASKTGPEYYKATGVEPWDAMEAWLSREEFIGFLKGNAIKYLARSSHKGQHDEDLKKAEHYLRKLNEVVGEEKENAGPMYAKYQCAKAGCGRIELLPYTAGDIIPSEKQCMFCLGGMAKYVCVINEAGTNDKQENTSQSESIQIVYRCKNGHRFVRSARLNNTIKDQVACKECAAAAYPLGS